MLTGEALYDLIPQRPPIVMVDALWSVGTDNAVTGLTIAADNVFVENGCLREAGLIEHIAQSAAAFSGYDAFSKGLPPRLGYIGEIKQMRIAGLPCVGSRLTTRLQVVAQAGMVTLMSAKVECEAPNTEKTVVAECQIKIFMTE